MEVTMWFLNFGGVSQYITIQDETVICSKYVMVMKNDTRVTGFNSITWALHKLCDQKIVSLKNTSY